MEEQVADGSEFNSEVIAFMKDHRDRTVGECLELYLQDKVRHEEESYRELVMTIKQTSEGLLADVEQGNK